MPEPDRVRPPVTPPPVTPPPVTPSPVTPSAVPPELAELARLHGVATGYTTDLGRHVPASPDTLRAVLAALGVDAATPGALREALAAEQRSRSRRLLPPSVVVRAGRGTRLPGLPPDAVLRVATEDGRSTPLTGTDRGLAGLPVGRHTLHAEHGGRTATAPLLVAPTRLATPGRRDWGFLVQLYSVLSERSWGMGDLGDLAGLARWAGRLGAGFLQLNPLHAYVPGELPDPSPYRPSSRRFPDPVNLRIEAVPESQSLDAAARARLDELTARAARLREGVLREDELIDRAAVWALKREALELLHLVPRSTAREAAHRRYLAREGAGLRDFATWCALAEVHGTRWRSWPAGLRAPDGPAVAAARRELAPRIAFHSWLSWLADEQLATAQRAAADAGMGIGLVHDLAVGVDPEGADAWSLRNYLAEGMTVGCPPDDFNPHGQDWGLPPWRPDTLAEAGYAPYAEVLRGTLRRSGALRLDHIMGLFRLWWVPAGAPAAEGAYVRYDHEAMLGVLALEAHRTGSMVIGEDLGTVEPGVREELRDRGILGTSVLRFEYAGGSERRTGPLPAEQWRADCVATLTTHDLPTTAAWLEGEHIRLHDRLGLLAEPAERAAAAAAAERAAWLDELARAGARPEPADEPPPETAEGPRPGPDVLALHRFLALTPARMIGVWLPDTVGDRRPQNLPGTVDEYPNWRLPVADADGRPLALDQLTAAPGPRAVARIYADTTDSTEPRKSTDEH
ncbi:4-alpha-glucanotransferase [Streptacidiphilus sp. P02-A3a]|uniref:4-alpha-glucanotransferase n=1 Tax=Streptacidiphilus sp. P02-A3a TaxID=2704468 RepID=UPI0015FB6D38|nr:4-alpha-glucanotransferase [Streptacidiphilus sp. P02-A3a]QMU71256.1 4-alpha-glucanotransferase [Streptacidiphilus sp. P02-A3a]